MYSILSWESVGVVIILHFKTKPPSHLQKKCSMNAIARELYAIYKKLTSEQWMNANNTYFHAANVVAGGTLIEQVIIET